MTRDGARRPPRRAPGTAAVTPDVRLMAHTIGCRRCMAAVTARKVSLYCPTGMALVDAIVATGMAAPL